ncbi:hypothetical protein [Marinobacterium jannaschii]|uniref:hypothetical protein n=1 Tax=Marinobacterium jannaschii TaxID=64970 RepID=UPI0012EC4F9B|nr:hypothetical protein [Marinobacterium jannaschii]
MLEVLKESWSEFLVQLKPLVIATLPWIVAVVALSAVSTVFSEKLNGFVEFLLSAVEMILQAMVAFAGLQVLFKSRGEAVEVTSAKIIIYIMAAAYIGIATMLGMMIFIILGVIIMAASFFAPIYILQENQGPIEAVASSASLLQGRVFRVTFLLCGVWLAIYAIEYVLILVFGMLPISGIIANIVTSGLVQIIGLMTLPVMVQFKTHLVAEQSKKIQPMPDSAG